MVKSARNLCVLLPCKVKLMLLLKICLLIRRVSVHFSNDELYIEYLFSINDGIEEYIYIYRKEVNTSMFNYCRSMLGFSVDIR